MNRLTKKENLWLTSLLTVFGLMAVFIAAAEEPASNSKAPKPSEKGRWIAADNWHGDIGIFHSKTTRTYILTKDHRTYGKGTHPEVGWDRKGEQVIFASHKFGNVDVCIATIPQGWQESWKDQVSVP